MATGYKLNGTDFENIFEKTRDASRDLMSNIDSNFKTSGSGLTLLNSFLSVDPNKPYQSVANGGGMELSSRLIQSPALGPLVLQGKRPRMDSYSWSYSYENVSIGSYEELWLHNDGEKLTIGRNHWVDYSLVVRRMADIVSFPKSAFPGGKVPDVLFFVMCAGGGGSRGHGLWPAGVGGGGGGGGGIILGWTYTFPNTDNSLQFILGGGGSKGIGQLSPTTGKAGLPSRVVLDTHNSSTLIATANGGGGGGKQSVGSGGGVGVSKSSSSILGTRGGQSGRWNSSSPGAINGYMVAGDYDRYYVSGLMGNSPRGGGASLGSGAGGYSNNGQQGSGASGSNGYGADGGNGGSGGIIFFY